MSAEQWRPVPGWNGLYEVSDLGRVRSLARTVTYKDGRFREHEARTLQPTVMRSGHFRVGLSARGRCEQWLVHRLVLTAFIGPCPLGSEGCHSDGDPANNSLSNLRWDTRSANLHDAVRHGRHVGAAKKSCVHGHPFSSDNTYIAPGAKGKRVCRQCKRDRARAAYRSIRFEETR